MPIMDSGIRSLIIIFTFSYFFIINLKFKRKDRYLIIVYDLDNSYDNFQ